MASILESPIEHGVLSITLNRPELHNAFDEVLIAELTAAFRRAARTAEVRAVVLAASGASFSAGADLSWMRRMAEASFDDNRRDALALVELLRAIDECPRPVIAIVQGPAYGGGVGLIAACDVAIGVETANFALTEVRLGLVPATICPYVVRALGERACRRFFLTAERFSAAEARRLGLLHEVVPADGLAPARDRLLHALAQGGPQAQTAVKRLLRDLSVTEPGQAVGALTAELIATLRASPEGREGLGAFLDKRAASWHHAGK